MMAAAAKSLQDAQALAAATEQKMKDLTTAMAAIEQQKVAQQETMTKTQNAVPVLKAALEQAKSALALLPDNADIKASAEGLATVVDRQEKSLPVMVEQIAAMDKQMTDTKTEIEAAAKVVADAKQTMQTADAAMKTLTAEIPQVEAQVTAANTVLSTAEQAVQAAAAVVESRRQQLRPQVQVTQN